MPQRIVAAVAPETNNCGTSYISPVFKKGNYKCFCFGSTMPRQVRQERSKSKCEVSGETGTRERGKTDADE